jgi:CO/xanthine dehydrogenase Mo-binding subunit
MRISRRQFIKASAISGGGLVLGFQTGCQEQPLPHLNSSDFQPNAWLQITTDNRIIFHSHKVEMGQGVITGLVTLVAEELKVGPEKIEFMFAPVHKDFRDPDFYSQMTVASNSIKSSFLPIRKAGAAAREMLLQAAASHWQVDRSLLAAKDGKVLRTDSDATLPYGELVELAKKLPVPDDVALTPNDDLTLVGHYNRRLDSDVKVNGQAQFSIDVNIPGCLTAVLVRCPHLGGQLKTYDAHSARDAEGVVAVFPVADGLAVVAESYWQATTAADLLEIEWEKGPLEHYSNAVADLRQQQLLDQEDAHIAHESGDNDTPFSGTTLEAEYSVPYLAHATMEPLNATVSVSDSEVTVWVGTQAPEYVRDGIARALGRPRESVTVHSHFMGGGFGRRAIPDFAVLAALVAEKMSRPVKLIWRREDDLQHDHYRPSARCRFRAVIGDSGEVRQWHHRVASESVIENSVPNVAADKLPAWIPRRLIETVSHWAAPYDPHAVEGAADIAYRFPNSKVEYAPWKSGVPIFFWRSVGLSINAFFVESFIDELAAKAQIDPYLFRRRYLEEDPRYLATLDAAVTQARSKPLEYGCYQGMAIAQYRNTRTAQVAEISIDNNAIRVKRVVCAIDCGQVVNPDIVRSQAEGAIIFGLTAALYGEINFEKGAVKESNFHDYPLLRFHEAPEIEVIIMNNGHSPTGAGEAGVPGIAPAVANAVFEATGQRLRDLPLKLT